MTAMAGTRSDPRPGAREERRASRAVNPVRVLVVDDSATMRELIRRAIASDSRLCVVGEAANARQARDAVRALAPDVMTLDIEMPGMDGLEFLARLMRARPMPVVMFSSTTPQGSDAALRALSLGAVDCIEKPGFGRSETTFLRLTRTLQAVARAPVAQRRPPAPPPPENARWRWNGKTILIGASTGGVEALETVLRDFPLICPPTLITQHMPAAFLRSFADRLNANTRPSVRLAAEGDRPVPGTVYIAPGGTHLRLRADGKKLGLSARGNRSAHCPSVDEMFASAVPHARRVVAILLTGMGRDGAAEMKSLRDAGAVCIGQDRQSSIVYGMPGAAVDLGAVDLELPLHRIAAKALRLTARRTERDQPAR